MTNARASRRTFRAIAVGVLGVACVLAVVHPTPPAQAVRRSWPATGWTNPVGTDFEDWGFGSCSPPYVGNYAHLGADSQGAPSGRAVGAMAPGVVIGKSTGWPGDALGIEHTAGDGSRFIGIYGHINASVGPGASVAQGQVVGTVLDQGSNSHLHLGVRPLAAGEAASAAMIRGRTDCASYTTYGHVDPIPWLSAHPLTGGGPIRGAFDSATSPAPGQLRVAGWAFDEDARTTAINIHVYIGGPAGTAGAQGIDIGPANAYRPDVNNAYPGVGNSHGYDRTIDVAKFGSQPVFVYAINAQGTPGNNVLIASRTVNVPQPNPFGSLDDVDSPRPGWLHVRGWTADPSSPTKPLEVHVYGGPNFLRSIAANVTRPDVGAALPGYGNLHGYDAIFPATPGTYSVCTYGINVGVGTNNTQLGCRSVTVAADVTPPETTIASAPPPSGTATTVAFEFTSNESDSTSTCQWDASDWQTCTSPQTQTLSPGTHTFSVRATDAAGNTDASPASRTFTIAAPTPPVIAPTPPLPQQPPGPTTATAPSKMKAPKVIVRGRKVIVKWKAPAANGAPITGYLVDIRKGKDKITRPGVHKVAFKRLKPGTNRIHIAARNTIGTSPFSAWVKVRIPGEDFIGRIPGGRAPLAAARDVLAIPGSAPKVFP